MTLTKEKKAAKPHQEAIRHIEKETVIFSTHALNHALKRMQQRKISEADIFFIIENGWYTPSRDRHDLLQGWSYCFEGLDEKKRTIRVIVSIDSKLLVITVIGLNTSAI